MKAKIKSFLRKHASEKMYNQISSVYIFFLLLYIGIFFRSKKMISIIGGNFKMIIDPQNGFTDKMLYRAHCRDKDITDILDIYLREDSIFIDIGMNIGYETLWAAKLVGKHGKVISFEPIPRLIGQVKESLALNGFENVTIIPKALGEQEGTAEIFFHNKDAGLSSLVNKEAYSSKEIITIGKMDNELKDISNINLIKIDVEGYEYEVLCGGALIIQKFLPPIVFEFTPHVYESTELGKSIKILKYFTDLNYSLYVLTSKGPSKVDTTELNKFVNYYTQKKIALNILACQK